MYIAKENAMSTLPLPFMRSMRLIVNAFVRERNRRMSQFNLTSSQVDVLVYLIASREKEEVNQVEIQEEFDLSCPTVNGILDRLEKKGLVRFEKSTRDQRRKKIILTQIGKDMEARLIPLGYEWKKELSSCFCTKELNQLNELLDKLEKHLNKLCSKSKKGGQS